MKICLIGDFSGTPDEGMKNISRTTFEHLSARNDVLALTARSISRPSVIRRLINFRPGIVHYLHGPTIRSLAMLKMLKAIPGQDIKTVASATRPYFSKYARWMVSFLKPDTILTQSIKFERFFQEYGCRVAFLPNGVDCHKFAPVEEGVKKRLRLKHGLPLENEIVLHVGHIKQNRKLDLFLEIQKISNVQVVVAGGTVEKTDEGLKAKLQNAGIKVIHRYLEDISELYKAADRYVFPISDMGDALPDTYNRIGSIDLPLSVLEAMACNLQVISTPFGALPRLFEQGDGLEYAVDERCIVEKVKDTNGCSPVRTRNKVLPLDWQRIIGDLEARYQMLMEEPCSGLATVPISAHPTGRGTL